MVQIVQLHRRGAGSQALVQAHAGGLVTVVGAVVDVVGAVEPGEQLQQESRFVG